MMTSESPASIDYMLHVRRAELLPSPVFSDINRHYDRAWRPNAERSYEPGERFEIQIKDLWIEKQGKKPNILDILPKRIESVLQTGSTFRILDIGCGTSASFFTGHNKYSSPYDKTLFHGNNSLMRIISSWGFKPGKDFEMIAVHGGDFDIPVIQGLQKITANIYNGIPDIKEKTIDLLLSRKTVYQDRGGLYLLEYFDRLLRRGKMPGVAIIWPYDNFRIHFFTQNGEEIDGSAPFSIAGINTWRGQHADWIARETPATFPVFPIGYYQDAMSHIFYGVLPQAVDNFVSSGGTLCPPEEPFADTDNLSSPKIHWFTTHTLFKKFYPSLLKRST